MRNVILFGEMYSGKSTIARALGEAYGYKTALNAGNIKQLAARVYNRGFPIDKSAYYGITDPTTGLFRQVSGRELLQGVGQAIKTFDRDFWLRWFLNDIDMMEKMGTPLVVDDGRFPFEADAMRNRGWLVVRVWTPERIRMERAEQITGRRPTIEELQHPTEVLLDEIEYDMQVSGAADPIFEAAFIRRRAIDRGTSLGADSPSDSSTAVR